MSGAQPMSEANALGMGLHTSYSTLSTSSPGSPGSGRDMRFVRNPIAEPELIETAAPALGQHTAEIMAELDLT